MSFPTIPTVAAGRVLFSTDTGTASPSTRTFPDLSSLTKNAGDLLIAIITTYQSSTNPQFSSWGGGFTECSDQGSGTTMGIGVAYKWSTGSETGTFTVTQAATVTGHASMCLLSIPLAHATTPPEAGTIANGTSAAADPGAFNPAGWAAEDTLWISVVTSGMTSGTGSWTATGTTAPTNYGDRADSNTTDSSTVGQTEIAVSFRQLNAASEDVGTAGVDTSNARNSALVIAVRPAPATHATDGALTGPGTTVAGVATRFRAHPTSGAIAGPGSTIVGTAARSAPPVTHATDGALTGPGTTVSGSAARTRQHATTGALSGPGSSMSGTAARTRQHPTSGELITQGSIVVGSAARTRQHAAAGGLTGPGSEIVGSATRSGAGPITHDSSGELVGSGSAIDGSANLFSANNEVLDYAGGGYPIFKKKKPYKRIDDIVEKTMRELYEGITATAPQQVRKQAAKIVRQHIIAGVKPVTIPPASIIDWAALELDAARVSALIGLWRKQVNDEEIIREEEDILLLMTM